MIQLVLILGVIQGALLTLLLITRKTNKLANRLLGSFTAVLTLECLDHLTHNHDFLSTHPYLTDLLSGFSLAYGPLLFLYIKYLTEQHSHFKWLDLLHFLPLLLLKAYELPFFLSSNEYKLALINRPEFFTAQYTTTTIILNELLFIQCIVYAALSIRSYERYRQKTGATKLKWLGYFSWLILGQWVLFMLLYQFRVFVMPDSTPFEFSSIIVVLFIYLISYRMLLQPEIIRFSPNRTEKVRKSPVNETERQLIIKRLDRLMEEEKPYLDQQLKLDGLATALNINRYYLSQLINEEKGKNFSDFINEYRVSEARIKLGSAAFAHYKLIAIGEASGFNSKTAFNTAFKKFSGVTPSDYRKHQNSTTAQVD